MKQSGQLIRLFFVFGLMLAGASCHQKKGIVSDADLKALDLKKGEIIICGSTASEFGRVGFALPYREEVQKDFNEAIALLHSFEYDESEKLFARVITAEPGCALAYWGVALSNFHLLWTPPNEAELTKGSRAITIARSLKKDLYGKESEYVEAAAKLFNTKDEPNHHMRCVAYEEAMESMYLKYPDDVEVAIFYSLALVGSADPSDKSFQNQRKAGAILMGLAPSYPNHPGIAHYVIHAYDYPVLAELALPAARKYASIAPSSSHAQHMPSHIFVRMGLWDDCIKSNLTSVSFAKCYAENTAIKGHWDEELHGLDYLVYAYLQKGDNAAAKAQVDYVNAIDEVFPVNFKDAYAFAAIPARYVLENRLWKEAASLELHPQKFAWDKFPWQEAIAHFAKVLGFINTGDADKAKNELIKLSELHDILLQQRDEYKANLVKIQMETGEAWLQFKYGKNKMLATESMVRAADREDATEKHPVTPGEVIPARELLGDMWLQMNEPIKALEAYEKSLLSHPNRFNGLYGAAQAALKAGNKKRAQEMFKRLVFVAGESGRKEVKEAKTFLGER